MAEKKTLGEWAKLGVSRVRLAVWANPEDYVRLDLFDGMHGPWLHLYAPVQAVLGYPSPQDVLAASPDTAEWERYLGPKHAKDALP